MDRGIKMLLFVIAVSLIILNLQIAGVSFLPEAHAEIDSRDVSDVVRAIRTVGREIASAILNSQ